MPKASRGWENAKKVNDRERHVAVDIIGLLLEVLATPASVQVRDAARPASQPQGRPAPHPARLGRQRLPRKLLPRKLLPRAAWLKATVEIVKRPPGQHTFQVMPRRWVVERTLARIISNRRGARDCQRLPADYAATVYRAMISLTTRRLARPH